MATEKEDGKKRKSTHSCFYCRKMVNSRARVGHLSANQEEIKSRGIWNYPGCSSNSIDINRTNPYPFLNSQPQYASPVSGNNLTQFGIATSPLEFNQKFSNETSMVNASKFPADSLGNAKTQFIMSPNLSSGSPDTEFHHSNSLLPLTFAPAMSSTVFVPSGGTTTIGFSSDHSMGRDGVCHFNTDEFRTWQDGFPYLPRGALPKFQGNDLNKLPHTTCAMFSSGPGLGSNQFSGAKEPTSTAPFSPGPCLCSCHNDVTLHEKRHFLTCERGKRSKSSNTPGGVNVMNLSKKPKIVSNPSVETEKMKEFPHPPITDERKSVSALGISVDAAQEGPSSMKEVEDHTDLDLSLHL